jgi:undecaprenyl phosphate-alpha-L-ara4N flippase subunit ArnE
MTPLALMLLGVCVATETAQQLCYRMAGRNRHRFIAYVAPAIGIYCIELVCWLTLLKFLPLGVALPARASSYAVIPLAASVVFRERVAPRQWVAIVLIAAGVVLVTMHPSV